MRKVLFFLLFVFTACHVLAQDSLYIDSLKRALVQAKEDTNKVNLYTEISSYYTYSEADTALAYAMPGLALARKLNFAKGEIWIMCRTIGEALAIKGNLSKALEVKLEALQKAEQLKDPVLLGYCYNFLGSNYSYSRDYEKALFYYNKVKEIKNWGFSKYLYGQIGRCYLNLNKLDSAYYYTKQAYDLDVKDSTHWTEIYIILGDIENKRGNYTQALQYYRVVNTMQKSPPIGLAFVFNKIGREDSAIFYAKKYVKDVLKLGQYYYIPEASSLLTDIYKSKGDTANAFIYQQIMLAAKDSLMSQEKVKYLQTLSFNEHQRQQEILAQQEEYRNRIKLYGLLTLGIVISAIAFLLWRNNQYKQRALALLQKQKQETDLQKAKAEKALQELQTTQTQLVQREKLASLGELTAGIAHEIQNPLNFVNNFSEVSEELCGELEAEAKSGHTEEILAITSDLKGNLSKISHHGKRADSIVKSMLQHSRASSGEKQLTDINALVDEYLRLAFHGQRAKDKDFNADFKLDTHPSVAKLEVIPQEIGRVLLNLFNNAFYATQQKQAQLNGQYQPQVMVSTKAMGDKIEIRVRDNGTGMPEHIKSKIFQPFFTTKPTGEGTGLGLSLSYDIITKVHGGELKVETTEGEFAEFIIWLPISK